MPRLFISVIISAPLFPLVGQETTPPAIVGELRTSVGNTQPTSRVLLNRPIKDSKVIRDQGRTITIYQVGPPIVELRQQQEKPSREESPRELVSEAKPSSGFTVSATVLSDNLTRLEWWSHSDGQAKKHVSWSNIGWKNIQGFNTIEDAKRSYTFMLFLSGDSVDEFNKRAEDRGLAPAPDLLPDFSQSGARYSNEDDKNIPEAGKAFMEAIHALYDSKEVELKQAQKLRQENRERYRKNLELNPPKKEDVVIQFWERDLSKEAPTKKGK